MIFVFVWLTSLSMIISRSIHVVANGIISFFLWLSNIPSLWPPDSKNLLSRKERPWCWERLQAGGEGDERGRDGWMASLTQWTWIWASSGRWWRTGKTGVLQSMGLQRVGHNWVTEQEGPFSCKQQKLTLVTLLVVQWLRLCAPNVGAWVWSLVRKIDATGCTIIQLRETDYEKPEQEKGFIRKQETLVSNDDSVGVLVGVGRDGVGGITDWQTHQNPNNWGESSSPREGS